MESEQEEKPKLHRPLVSVERQFETDIATGKTETRMFVKMYFDARDSGLLAAIGARRWQTLCCLATFMDENGNCYPSQTTVAKSLGVSRQMANERIQELGSYRFHGRPVITISNVRDDGGKWGRNIYQIHPIAGLRFGKKKQGRDTVSRKIDTASMSSTESRKTDTVKLDTNKNQEKNKNTHEVRDSIEGDAQKLVAIFHRLCRHSPSRRPTKRELFQAHDLISTHGIEKANYVIAYAINSAEETRFRMQHFGAVLGYTQSALEEYEKKIHRQRRSQAEQGRRREDDRKHEKFIEAWNALPLEERVEQRLATWIETQKLIKRRAPTPGEIEAKRFDILELESDNDAEHRAT